MFFASSYGFAGCGIHTSGGTAGDPYDNVLVELIIGPHNTGSICRRGPLRNVAAEFATIEKGDRFNNRFLIRPIGNAPLTGYEQQYYRGRESHSMAE